MDSTVTVSDCSLLHRHIAVLINSAQCDAHSAIGNAAQKNQNRCKFLCATRRWIEYSENIEIWQILLVRLQLHHRMVRFQLLWNRNTTLRLLSRHQQRNQLNNLVAVALLLSIIHRLRCGVIVEFFQHGTNLIAVMMIAQPFDQRKIVSGEELIIIQWTIDFGVGYNHRLWCFELEHTLRVNAQ